MKKLIIVLVISIFAASCAKEHCNRVEVRQLNGLTGKYTTISDGEVCGKDALEAIVERNHTYVDIPYGNGFYRITTLVKVY